MRIAGVREVKQKFSEYLDAVRQSPLIVTKRGRPYAAIIELTNDMDMEAFLCAHDHRLMKMFDKSAASEREIPFEKVERMLKRAAYRKKRYTR